MTLKKTAAPVADKRTAVLNAALGLFSRYGLHGTSVDQVAARAGVSKSNLLYYFANKEELYVCVLRDLLEVWLAPLRMFHAEQDPQRVIGDYIRRKLAVSRDSPDASRLFCLEIIQGAPPLHLDRGKEYVEHGIAGPRGHGGGRRRQRERQQERDGEYEASRTGNHLRHYTEIGAPASRGAESALSDRGCFRLRRRGA